MSATGGGQTLYWFYFVVIVFLFIFFTEICFSDAFCYISCVGSLTLSSFFFLTLSQDGVRLGSLNLFFPFYSSLFIQRLLI